MAEKSKQYITINTSLINKKEIFKMLALAHATSLPILLVGVPGTGKTKVVLDYAKAYIMSGVDPTNQVQMLEANRNFMDKVFILETDEGTKSSEIKGTPDIEEMFINNKYKMNTPIADAEIVIINEVDKASSTIRNSLLGVMNEKFLFNGKEKIPCKWKLLVATCNEIPKEEENSPFWDRFILKKTVNRISAGELTTYYSKGGKDYQETFSLNIPTKDEIGNIKLPLSKLEKYLSVAYSTSSDRTLTFVPTLSKAISQIWDESLDKALVRTAAIMVGTTAASALKENLMNPEVKSLLNKIEVLWTVHDATGIEVHLSEIETLLKGYAAAGKIDEDQVETIEDAIQFVLSEHPLKKKEAQVEQEASTFNVSGEQVKTFTESILRDGI